MRSKKHRAFTLIELVIVMAIIGVLTLMLVPQYHEVMGMAKLRLYENNCIILSQAMSIYGSKHGGQFPSSGSELNPYIRDTFESLVERPTGAVYLIEDGTLTATYTDYEGNSHPFTFPE